MTEISVEQICTKSLTMRDKEAKEALQKLTFPNCRDDETTFVRVSHDPEDNTLEITIAFLDDGGERIGELSVLMVTDYLLAGMLHAVSTPIVKHMIKEG